jgi:hypothetical protein
VDDEHRVELVVVLRSGTREKLCGFVDCTHRHIRATPLDSARQAITADTIRAASIVLSDAIERMHAAPTLAQAHDQADQFLRRLRAATE